MLEICTFSLEGAFKASQVGCTRLEVCMDYQKGGITPPAEWVFSLKHSLPIPVWAMIRPNAHFEPYKKTEWNNLRLQAQDLVRAGADGLVFGALNSFGRLDIEGCAALISCIGKPFTLHRAFDLLKDPFLGIDDAIQSGFSRILTSWGQRDMNVLTQLRDYAGKQIEILPGGGIRSSNVKEYTMRGFTQIHSSAITDAHSQEPNSEEIKRLYTALKAV